MALLEVRRRGSTFLFFAVVVAHIVLISAQVTSKSGVPVLQAVTFGLVGAGAARRRRGHHRRDVALDRLP